LNLDPFDLDTQLGLVGYSTALFSCLALTLYHGYYPAKTPSYHYKSLSKSVLFLKVRIKTKHPSLELRDSSHLQTINQEEQSPE